jgi:hypothetical protein
MLIATTLQILAMFITVPPLISVVKMTPRFKNWLIDLAWVRFVTHRPQKQTIPAVEETHIPLTISAKNGSGRHIDRHATLGYAADGKDADELEV